MIETATATRTKGKGFYLNLPITKIDVAKREVWGFATTEDLDVQNEVVDFDASVRAFEKWSGMIHQASGGKSAGNIREMHQPKVVGSMIAWSPDEIRRGIWVGAKLSKSQDGEDAWLKVQEGLLNGFSIGAPQAERQTDVVDGKKATRVVDYELSELSLVDNPACPGSFFQEVKIAKSAGVNVISSTHLDPIGETTVPDSGMVAGMFKNAIVDPDGTVWMKKGRLKKVEQWDPITPQQEAWVGKKIKALLGEGKPGNQAIAIAHSMAEERFGKMAEFSTRADPSAYMNITPNQKPGVILKCNSCGTDLITTKGNAMTPEEIAAAEEKEKAEKAGKKITVQDRKPGQAAVETQAGQSVQTPTVATDPDGKPVMPSKKAEGENTGKPGGPHDNASNPVAAPATQGKEADAMLPGQPPMPPAAPKANPMYTYCAMCAGKLSNQAQPAHAECMQPAAPAQAMAPPAVPPQGAPPMQNADPAQPFPPAQADQKNMVPGQPNMQRPGSNPGGYAATAKAALEGLQKAFGGQFAGIQKTITDGFQAVETQAAALEKRMADVEKTPIPGGPARTELPDGVAPVSKSSGDAGSPSPEAILEKAAELTEDPQVRQGLQMQVAKASMKEAFRSREGKTG